MTDKCRKLKENEKEDSNLRVKIGRLIRKLKEKAERDRNNWMHEECKETEEYAQDI